MSKPKDPKPQDHTPNAEKPRNALAELFALAARMTDEERMTALAYGIPVPTATPDGRFVRKFGYFCAHCCKPALYFIGETFVDQFGKRGDLPPANTPIDKLTWTQDLDPHKIDRQNPACQHCGTGILLNGRNLVAKRVIHCEKWEASRAESEQKLQDLRHDLGVDDGRGGVEVGRGQYKPPTVETALKARVADGTLTAEQLDAADESLRRMLSPAQS